MARAKGIDGPEVFIALFTMIAEPRGCRVDWGQVRRLHVRMTNGTSSESLADYMASCSFEHDVLRTMIQHVASHFFESFPALDDLEKMIAGELTDLASEA